MSDKLKNIQREMSDKLKDMSQFADDYTQSQPAFGWTALPPIVDAPDTKKIDRPKSVSSIASADSLQPKSVNYESMGKSSKDFKLPDDFMAKVEEIARLRAELDALRGSLHKVT
jgi:hypothetical protein